MIRRMHDTVTKRAYPSRSHVKFYYAKILLFGSVLKVYQNSQPGRIGAVGIAPYRNVETLNISHWLPITSLTV